MLRHQNKTESPRKDAPSGGLLRLLAPTMIALGVCVACFFGATWAWFATSLNGEVDPIQTASFAVSAEVVEVTAQDSAAADLTADLTAAPAGTALTPSANGEEFLLVAGKTYRVTLTANGTASAGYCVVNFAGVNYTTDAIHAGGASFVFYVTAPETGANLSIQARWGTPTAATLGQGMTLTASGVSNTAPQLQPAAATEPTTEPETAPTESTEATQPTQAPTTSTEPTEPATEAPTETPTEAPTEATSAPVDPTE